MGLFGITAFFGGIVYVLAKILANLSRNKKFTKVIFDFMTKYRTVVIVLVVVPLSFIFEMYFEARDWFFRKFQVAPKLHEQRVQKVVKQVKEWNEMGLRGKKRMCTARKAWLTMSPRTASFKSDCFQVECALRDILEVDTKNMIIRTEPLVDMRYMTRHLVPMGYQLAIQVEMEDLTIGGLSMGLGMETNCHIYGLIQETVIAFEIVLSDGRLVRATKDNEFSDLFHALPWSHGTLGFLVAVELKIIPLKPFMHITYIPCHTKQELCDRLKQLSEADDCPSFLEATVYSKETSVIMTGEFSECDTPEVLVTFPPHHRSYTCLFAQLTDALPLFPVPSQRFPCPPEGKGPVLCQPPPL